VVATLTPLLILLINRFSARVLSFTIVLRKRKKWEQRSAGSVHYAMSPGNELADRETDIIYQTHDTLEEIFIILALMQSQFGHRARL